MKKVGYLGQNSRPVDGIYGCEFLGFVDFGVSKKGLNNILSTLDINYLQETRSLSSGILDLPGNHQTTLLLGDCVHSRPKP